MRRRHRIFVAREQYKLSCAHMTVFPDGTKERLHGHNYQVGVAIEVADVSLAAMVPFGDIKQALGELCALYKERTLLAEKNPHFEVISDTKDEIEFRLCGARYVLPRADVLLLPIDNIAVEPLAQHVAELLVARLAKVLEAAHILGLEATIAESPGQGASCHLDLEK
ncbi:MAG TPA: 6-carboxytetrahydropterin synthase [Kofleriaceae bacterium]|jgi:6-pyruvoyltetrahydropterin/6-carboxytetrahydropterin synthase|nr:6-carboxytetrahydropterin synthase [Kofleriaceae bacterium]